MRVWSGLLGLMLARLVVLSGLLLGLALLLPGDSMAFYAFMALAYTISIPYALWLRSQKSLAHVVPMQFLVDLVVVTGVVYFTGGLRSELFMLYPLIILSAATVTAPDHALKLTAFSAIIYVTLVVLMQQGVLIGYAKDGGPVPQTELARTLILRLFIFACFGLAGAYVSERCQVSDRKLAKFRDMAEVFFRHVQAGLVLLDSDGTILMVNERACRLLGQSEDRLLRAPIQSLVGMGTITPGEKQEKSGAACYLRRPDGSMFPIGFEMAPVSLPMTAVPGVSQHGHLNGFIMVFSDITRILEMKEQIKRAERVRAAVELAAEIAHEIRNPLTAISGAAQLLQHRDDQPSGRPDAEMAGERAEALGIIVEQAGRVDRIMERFIDFTEYSPEALKVRFGFDEESPTDAFGSKIEEAHPSSPDAAS